jgi:hypothetical protein
MNVTHPPADSQPNGAGSAAVLAAGFGSLMLSVFAIAGDKLPAVRRFFIFYTPTGPLSGVTTCAIVVWLGAWALLYLRWRTRQLNPARINIAAIILLVLGFLMMFPPIADLF